MQIHGPTTPDPNGQLEFTGHPQEVQEGDILYAGGDSFAVRDKPKSSNNFGKPATELVLCEVGAYEFEVPRGGEPEALARISLDNRMQVRFKRTVLTDEIDFGEEPQIFYELIDCDDDPDEPLTDPENEHYGHGLHVHEWRGKCRAVPKGLLVGINMAAGTGPVTMSCKIVDTVYPNGAVVFADGTSFQSHPDKSWIGWTV